MFNILPKVIYDIMIFCSIFLKLYVVFKIEILLILLGMFFSTLNLLLKYSHKNDVIHMLIQKVLQMGHDIKGMNKIL